MPQSASHRRELCERLANVTEMLRTEKNCSEKNCFLPQPAPLS
jgi:hypothetical protein